MHFVTQSKFELKRSQNNISNYIAHSRKYLVHTGENTSMLISKIFLYDAGVIFIFSRVEPSVYSIFCACCCELTSLISGNHKPSRKMSFSTSDYQMLLRFAFHQEHFNKVILFVSVVIAQYIQCQGAGNDIFQAGHFV